MDIFDEFPSSFFKATELVGKKLPVTISAVEKQEMNDGKTKPVLKFEEDPRGLVLNVENRTVLAERFGRDTRAWAGKKVVLITRRVQGPTGPCPGIRFADPPLSEQIDDEILESEDPAPAAPTARRKANFK